MSGVRTRSYSYTCRDCGGARESDVGWKARQQGPCLACARARNGWEHSSECIDPANDAHVGACQTGVVAK